MQNGIENNGQTETSKVGGVMGIKSMLLYKTKNAVCYRVACDCVDPDHDAHVDIEYDDHGIVMLTFYKKLSICSHWGEKNWFKEKWLRIKFAMKILWTGYAELETDMVFLEGPHLQSLLDCIQEGINELNKRSD
jgi:hypothetical protein